jgi:probable poly-beta-1,6-N-acetyl-D-glucosamine export protein
MRLNSMSYFRGLAILFIVAGHCIGVSGWYLDTVPRKLVANFLYGGTSFFVFISGFLFHHVFYKDFIYQKFITKKIKNVATPYILISIIPVFYYVFICKTGPHPEFFFSSSAGLFPEYIRPFILYLVTGGTFYAYWYIPFILVVFLLSPLFIAYIELSAARRILIMLLLLMVSAIIHRPVDNISVFQSVVYFAPVYLFGIVASIHKEQIYECVGGKEVYVLLAALALAGFQVVFYEIYLNFHKNPLEITVLDINIIQKSLLCLFFMVWLHRFENRSFPYLNKLAEASFAIYFLHPVVLLPFERFMEYLYMSNYRIALIAVKIVLFPVVVLMSFMLASLIKRMFRSKSRLIIGW